ncbi:hypothetical protein [Harryflintia acetispora]|uniref:Carbohydrate ABC transporter substrate-binding protein (CUT1 family) n=1 Tax=Harryflintia acetispora TaxID=1849041 RepID=A0A9X8UKL9_9FIRM|nr:hypothetical protein [Harryflintia acetispora]TCL44120.1 carbohydrate ABC transporter substrate-binding protein (CUT1 family) [Harryflintia acetispora]
MKKASRISAALIAMAMLLSSLAGCGSKTEAEPAESAPAGESSAASQATPEGEPAAEGITETPLPISAEKIELNFWWPYAEDLAELKDPNDGEFYQALEEKTNVHINWIIPAEGSETDAYNLLFASDDMPDIVMQLLSRNMLYRGGQDKAIDDGFFAELNDYTQYMPNYMGFLDKNPSLKKDVVTDSGKRYGMYQLFDRVCITESGLAVRQDFLDKLGLDRPVTYDDWHEMLAGFKSLGCQAPLYLQNTGIPQFGELSAGFGVAPEFFQVDGTVKYGPVEAGYKEYVTLMNQWYSEGLIDPDFMARTGSFTSIDNEMMFNDNIGACVTWTTRCDKNYVERGAKNEDLRLVGVAPPVQNAGDTTHIRSDDFQTGSVYSFSANSEHLVEAIEWMDYHYNYDVALDANYGLDDGRSFNMVDGKRILSYDFRYSNPEGVSPTAFFIKYAVKDAPLKIPDYQTDIFLPLQKESMDAWCSQPDDWMMPINITMTAEENTTYSSLMADIKTFVDENTVSFISGTKSLDEYDAFVEQIKAMGIDDAIAIQQAALDRYNNRPGE